MFRKFFVVGILLWSTLAYGGPSDDAEAAYKKRDFPTALNLWLPLAQQGNPAAERGLGILYENGLAVERDGIQATAWFRKAADQGDAEAEYRLGERYVMGDKGVPSGLPHDVSQGLALMIKASEQGHTASMRAIGGYYFRGWYGVPKDLGQAVAWFRKAADLDDAIAESQLGNLYESGNGVPRDHAQASFWYAKAITQNLKNAEQGNVVAQLSLAFSYETGGAGVERDEAAALKWYQRAAEQDGPLKVDAQKSLERLESRLRAKADSNVR